RASVYWRYMPRIWSRISLVQSRRVVLDEKRRPSGKSTACAAISLPASRYLVKSADDITSAWPALVNPSPAAPSVGNWRAGWRSTTPVKSRDHQDHHGHAKKTLLWGNGIGKRGCAHEGAMVNRAVGDVVFR